MLKEDKSITYLGKTFRTSISKPLSDEDFIKAREYILSIPDFGDVIKELKAIYKGKSKISAVTAYYFGHLMYEARNAQDAWSIMEALNYKPIMEYFNGKVSVNDKVFPPSQPLGERFKTAFRLCGIRCCRKVPQFPMKNLDVLLKDYCKEGDNYYDFCCGWGSRMLSAMKNKVNYFGTEPNDKLVNKLLECKHDFEEVNNTTRNVNIHAHGSEIYIEQWENTMDFVFSSPPYFNLEIYNGGKQSYVEGVTTYESWKEDWMTPTFKNIYRYLKDTGKFALNIKDIIVAKQYYPLEHDAVQIAESIGFKLIETRTLKNNKRTFGSVNWEKHTCGVSDKADENIYVFEKCQN